MLYDFNYIRVKFKKYMLKAPVFAYFNSQVAYLAVGITKVLSVAPAPPTLTPPEPAAVPVKVVLPDPLLKIVMV
jgi:hypothetical protein